jgi:putative ABC transport system ATP-binding protein
MNHILKLTDLKIFDFIEYPNIEIKSNSVTFISGKSGCGKSTLLQLLNGVISPKSGMIEYLGKNIEEYDSVELRKEIMLCGQSVFLFDTTISENFDEFYNFREMPHLPEIEKENFLKICSLDFSLNSQCTMLSGGERQRVFIAILLSLTPKI